ncbi:hypothetical protein P152DRAFT_454629 [Eremomyces bilateralis CBS 781.70]|uniref:tRNA-splicing endonuclease subunit Sen15 domain-containing protein n=1 Tax=Eremomyces bilateralis CBS 781.70 TaxID=1392243 RepID=A0A6G1GEB1_9PEZI|nr:uncharacterized protein P152DRAFT_454629 [Eremomyces bilateralis CBS 781.70]KAF1816364.1 hypothetical protein P152DRAFT_454629 [Eremomyces bilateralis CBS 781.70]
MSKPTSPPAASPLQTFISSYRLADRSPAPDPYLHLALQVAHNLRYQHQWEQITIHHTSPTTPFAPLPRPLISGLPPRRIYVHPDEQIEQVKLGDQRREARKNGGGDAADEDEDDEEPEPEREWILPTHLRERWSLKQMAAVFDEVSHEPPEVDDPQAGTELFPQEGQPANAGSGSARETSSGEPVLKNKWRTTKRVLLATVDDDSTIVFYITHDGIVKPRQN